MSEEEEIKGPSDADRYAWLRANRDKATALLVNSWQLDHDTFDAELDKAMDA